MAPRTTTAPTPSPRPRSGGRRLSREQVLAEQRLRLMMAMVEAIGQSGYRATTVADVVARAGVSRKTFYVHFANKRDCFLTTYDAVSARATRRLEKAYREAARWPERVEATIGALFGAAIENPAALRLATIEIAAAGPAGIERRERSIARYERFIRDAVEMAPGEGRISETTARAIVGGLYGILQRRGSSGGHSGLLALVPDLVTWATSYYPTPAAITKSPTRAARKHPGFAGGRAPGTLARPSAFIARRGLARGNQNVSRSFVVHSQRERILDAVANLVATKGYAALDVNDIAEQAAISLKAFYEHFADKEDAFLVAYELGHAKGLALVERTYAAQPGWREAVRAGISTLFHFLASEPAFAHIALVDALTATTHTAERSSVGVRAFARMLVPGLEEAPGYARPPAVTIEAIAAGVFELCLHYAVQGKIRELPELTRDGTYIALAPFIGAEEAARVATEAAV